MTQAGLHRNTITGEILSKTIQWCSNCGQNFSSTRAGDKHRVGKFFPNERKCLTGEDAGLTAVINKIRDARVYRL
jgi:hypothetical protein